MWFFYRVGVSYYDSTTCQLHVLEFWEDEDEDFPMVEMGTWKQNVQVAFESGLEYFLCNLLLLTVNAVKYQAQPCIIYTSTKSEQSFLNALQNNGRLLNNLLTHSALSWCLLIFLYYIMS